MNSLDKKSEYLSVSGLALSYEGETIIENLNFQLAKNEFVSLLGPSGVGKSTLLKSLAGILEMDKGQIFLDGKARDKSQMNFAYMPQSDLLFPWMSVYENVRLYDNLHSGNRQHSKAEVLELLEHFGLGGYEFTLPENLSGGMRQRAAFLRTILCPADIFLLDEPFGALDVITRNHLQDWLLDLRATLKRSILLVTHDLEEAIYLSDRILLLEGRPASIAEEYLITTPSEERSREWLFKQHELKADLYKRLEADSYFKFS